MEATKLLKPLVQSVARRLGERAGRNVSFRTDRLRCQEAMKTAARENPNRSGTVPRNRAPGAVAQNTSRSIKWAEKQEKFQPKEMCFFLTSTFIELIRTYNESRISLKVKSAKSVQLSAFQMGTHQGSRSTM